MRTTTNTAARRLLAVLLALSGAGSALGDDTPSGLPVPRFVSLRFDEVNGREGPSLEHPIAWRYTRRGLPVRVVAETTLWRRVQDPEGASVWMHRRTLDSRRMVMVVSDAPAALRRRPATDGEILAYLERDVIFVLNECTAGWCRIDGARASGWTPASDLWGLTEDEAVAR